MWRESIHDDLVLSVAMAIWYAAKYPNSRDRFLIMGEKTTMVTHPGKWEHAVRRRIAPNSHRSALPSPRIKNRMEVKNVKRRI
jgi:hypothetical protein